MCTILWNVTFGVILACAQNEYQTILRSRARPVLVTNIRSQNESRYQNETMSPSPSSDIRYHNETMSPSSSPESRSQNENRSQKEIVMPPGTPSGSLRATRERNRSKNTEEQHNSYDSYQRHNDDTLHIIWIIPSIGICIFLVRKILMSNNKVHCHSNIDQKKDTLEADKEQIPPKVPPRRESTLEAKNDQVPPKVPPRRESIQPHKKIAAPNN